MKSCGNSATSRKLTSRPCFPAPDGDFGILREDRPGSGSHSPASILRKIVLCLVFLAFSTAGCLTFMPSCLCALDDTPGDLTALGLEDLMNIEVTTASRTNQKLSDTAAAIFVISQEDIRRAGATCIPEVLRMAPGIQVAHIDANKWAITSRGFAGRFANKLLVLMDGRTIYSPFFSGVFWEIQDLMLEDIDRIEVIRGPGAALWGANAVNGVINIITKHSKDTQGGLVTSGYGTEEQGFGGARYGGRIGESTTYRFYGKYFNRGSFMEASGRDGADDWRASRGGFRIDSVPSDRDFLTIQGDIFDSTDGVDYQVPSLYPPYYQDYRSDTLFNGGNVQGSWKRTFSPTSDMTLQLYYNRMSADDINFDASTDTFDLDFQHQFRVGERQQILWGVGYRFTQESTRNTDLLSFNPSSRNNDLFSTFLQDEIKLDGDQLRLILGSKLEHDDISGFQVQPNGRLLWTPDRRHTLWTAVSRAVHTPSIGETDVSYLERVIPPGTVENPSPIPVVVSLLGNPKLEAEELTAFELGYRFQPTERLSLDIAAFYNMYDDLITGEIGKRRLVLGAVPHYVIPIKSGNLMDGDTYGVEISTEWQPVKRWKLQGAYTFLQMNLSPQSALANTSSAAIIEGRSPRHQFSLRSGLDLPHNWEFDLWFRYVDSLVTGNVPSYTTLDARLGWKPVRNLEISIVGQNLLDDRHFEFVPDFLWSIPTEVPRGVYGKITWRF
jgi:iron complex outermembrane recepter protein